MKSLFHSFILGLFLLFGTLTSIAQSTEVLAEYDVDEVNQIILDFGLSIDLVEPQFEVVLYKVSYETTHPNGEAWPVTGVLALPLGIDCPLPLSSYQHGTIARKTDAPSYLSDEALLGVLYASVGFACVLPDYIGLGDSPGLHLYVHAQSEALASLDLIRAAHELQDDLGYQLSDELFIWGYSQGGHATMALHKMIEEEFPEEFSVTASAPMSGPYDISGVQAEVITSDQSYPTPGYLPYVVISYQEVYGNLYESLDEVFLPQYADIIPELFDGTNSMGYINSQFPDVPSQALLPEVLEAYENDPEHPIRLALQDNDLYDWAPQAPVRLYYCEGDDQVSYLNSVVCLEAMQNNGANDVLAFDGGNLDHGGCAPLAMFAGFNYFNSIRSDFFGLEPNISSTPASAIDNSDGSISVELDDEASFTFEWSNGAETLSQDNLAPGVYTLTITNENGCSRSFNVTVDAPLFLPNPVRNELVLYPNPTPGTVNLGKHGFERVQVFGLTGRMLTQLSIRDIEALDFSTLPAGVYSLLFDEAVSKTLMIVR